MKHQHISFIKSGMRVVACIPLFWPGAWHHPQAMFAMMFIGAEVIGIFEEIGHE